MEITEPATYSIERVERVERDYYAALFRRDYGEAQRLYRELARTHYWSADRVVREAHKCGLYDAADRDEAEERYGDYLDLVETGAELLAALRDAYANTLDEDAAAEYELAFNRAVAKRFPRFAVAIGDA